MSIISIEKLLSDLNGPLSSEDEDEDEDDDEDETRIVMYDRKIQKYSYKNDNGQVVEMKNGDKLVYYKGRQYKIAPRTYPRLLPFFKKPKKIIIKFTRKDAIEQMDTIHNIFEELFDKNKICYVQAPTANMTDSLTTSIINSLDFVLFTNPVEVKVDEPYKKTGKYIYTKQHIPRSGDVMCSISICDIVGDIYSVELCYRNMHGMKFDAKIEYDEKFNGFHLSRNISLLDSFGYLYVRIKSHTKFSCTINYGTVVVSCMKNYRQNLYSMLYNTKIKQLTYSFDKIRRENTEEVKKTRLALAQNYSEPIRMYAT